MYLPPPYMLLKDAVREYARHSSPDEWRSSSLTESETFALSRFQSAHHIINEASRLSLSSLAGLADRRPVVDEAVERDATRTDTVRDAEYKQEWRDQIIDGAWGVFRDILVMGQIEGAAFLATGEVKILPPHSWASPIVNKAHISNNVIALIDGEDWHGKAVVRRIDLAALTKPEPEPGPSFAEGVTPTVTAKKGRGGRKPHSLWVEVAAEAARIIHEEGPPEGPEKLIARLTDYAALIKDDGGIPRTTVQPLVTRIFEKLRGEE